ncbi:MAG: hypothetical protein Unbinned3205contig1001_5 [Prokaryotic dsDNA virus sp.]|nr:MAG: hypothetical protein Unbinned3205contig1001_5 [Prokaryotic dsDNA virus sp.]|tara:strand:+ start:13294 stop:14241 length:948 start_codon:yes stop_codon:yes gene_type:complete
MSKNKQHNLSNPTIAVGASTYAGELALPYVHAATLSAPTIANQTVTVLQNVRFKAQIPVMANTGLVTTGGCNFTTTAETSLAESTLSVTDLMVNLQLCKANFRSWWQGDDYTINNGVPDDYADALLLYVANEVQGTMEANIWNGNSGLGSAPTLFNGLYKQYVANSGVVATLPANFKLNVLADVIAGLGKVVETIPANLIGQYEDVNIYVNPAVIDRYNIAIGQLGGGYNMSTADGGIQRFGGYKMTPAFGLPDGIAVVARPQDLAVGVGSADSVELAQAIDMTPLDGSDNYRITMRFAVGTQVPVIANVKISKS